MTAATTHESTSRISSSSDKGAPAKEDMRETLRRMQAAQRASRAPSYEARMAMLERLEQTLLRRKDAITAAISKDFGNRSKHETLIADIFVTVSAIKHARANLRDWMDPEP